MLELFDEEACVREFRAASRLLELVEQSRRPATVAAAADAVSLALGEPDFPTPEPIVDAARQALAEGWTHYADWNGDPELRQAVAETASEDGAHYGPDQVAVCHGGTAALMAAVMSIVEPGDRVVIPEPTYSLYADLVVLAGGVPVFVPTAPDFHLDLDRLADALSGARALMVCNPGNPTGAVLTGQEMLAVAAMLADTDTYLIHDEAYADLIYDGHTFAAPSAVPSLVPRLIACRTLSKTYAMTGWRIGYAVAPAPIAECIRRVHRTMNGALNTVVQRAALAALRLGPDLGAPMRSAYAQRRAFVLERLGAMSGLTVREPEGSFYAFPRYDSDLPSIQLAERLAGAGVIVRAGREYGPSGEGHLRLSFATDMRTLATGLERLGNVLAAGTVSA